jgi:hypothetical protein
LYANSYADDSDFWIPDAGKVEVKKFDSDWHWFFLHPSPKKDHFGLRAAFEELGCDVVHAHELHPARYSHALGLPTVYDDWEYFYEYYDVAPKSPKFLGKISTLIRRLDAKRSVANLIKKVPTIVTNKNVAEKYMSLGAKNIKIVPNVPLHYERDYATAVSVKKQDYPAFVYIGNLRQKHNLRTASELIQLQKLGCLHQFTGKDYLPHLEMLRKMREYHFNLLYWKPHRLHKYYLQNKAFIASVLGIPTIISDSLTATIDLLGEYAIVIRNPKEIRDIVTENEWRELPIKEEHFLEHYQHNLKEAYAEACD